MAVFARVGGAAAGLAGRTARKLALRSRWLARRVWLISAAEGALLARRHWKRLEPDERERLTDLARKARGRPSNLSDREHDELDELLQKLGHAELAGGIVGLFVPFRIVERLTARIVGRKTAERPQLPAG